MSLEKLVSKYVGSTEHVLKNMEAVEDSINIDGQSIRKVVEYVKAYLEDAKYYRDRKKFEVSLASVAYCEGLLDALKLLGAVKFEWPTKKKERKREK
jgi:FAD synthetase